VGLDVDSIDTRTELVAVVASVLLFNSPVTADAVTGGLSRLGHGGADVVVDHRSAGWVQTPLAAACAA
jgi:hypothetical protein